MRRTTVTTKCMGERVIKLVPGYGDGDNELRLGTTEAGDGDGDDSVKT